MKNLQLFTTDQLADKQIFMRKKLNFGIMNVHLKKICRICLTEGDAMGYGAVYQIAQKAI